MAGESTHGSVTQYIRNLDLDHPSEAQVALWDRYFRRLVGLARHKLAETPRRVADEEDVAVAALASFFEGHREGKFPQLRDRNDLWPLLARITANKAIDQQRNFLAQKRGAAQVLGESALLRAGESANDWPGEIVDQEVCPEFLIMMSEECNRLLSVLDDDELRTIACRRLEGYKNREIAQELGVIERTVERRVKLIRTIWEEDIQGRSR